MLDDDKLLWMFNEVYDMDGATVLYEDSDEPWVVVMKDGNLNMSINRTQLMFEYLTMHL